MAPAETGKYETTKPTIDFCQKVGKRTLKDGNPDSVFWRKNFKNSIKTSA